MWNWKPAKRVLDSLWDRGDLSIAGRQGFQRLYDLTERVIPREVLETPVPSEEEAMRALVLRAVRGARGAHRERHRRALPGARAHRHRAPARGGARRRGRRFAGCGWTTAAPPCSSPGAELPSPCRRGATLLSPFDNLLWDRPFAAACSASTT